MSKRKSLVSKLQVWIHLKSLLYALQIQVFYFCYSSTYTISRIGRSYNVYDNVGLAHEVLGEDKGNALLGFHSFTSRSNCLLENIL